MMRESVIYQEILAEGEQRERYLRLAFLRNAARTLTLIFRQLTRRVGQLFQPLLERLETLSWEQLEDLGEALLDFKAMAFRPA